MSDIAYARPSSTVVLVRAAAGEPELFMVKRHEKSSFGAAHAFPGGVVDSDDAAVHEFCSAVGEIEANSHLGVRANGLDYYSAAIRELFEESGVLLADIDRVDEDLGAVRDGLNCGAEDWSDFVTRNRLPLHCDKLYYISHWITPQVLKTRYSTRFFLAEMPAGQHASHCGGELTDSCWVSAHDMLEAGRAGKADLHFPTIKVLESIARHKTLDELVEWARSCVEWGVTSMLPAVVIRDGEEHIALPGEHDYPGAKS